ncbi:hypothetical protein HWV62_29320 [Athelia sp. TMB]|nr:hypothetical protein HWV62_29320 [Athelia sp. TMB]
MPARDQPDQSLVLTTRRQSRRPPTADEVISYAHKARSKTPNGVEEELGEEDQSDNIEKETGEEHPLNPAADDTEDVTPPVATDRSLAPAIATSTLDAPDGHTAADANSIHPLARSPTPSGATRPMQQQAGPEQPRGYGSRVIEDMKESTQAIIDRLMAKASGPTHDESEYAPSESDGDEYMTSASEGDGQQGSRIVHIMEGPAVALVAGNPTLANTDRAEAEMRATRAEARRQHELLSMLPAYQLPIPPQAPPTASGTPLPRESVPVNMTATTQSSAYTSITAPQRPESVAPSPLGPDSGPSQRPPGWSEGVENVICRKLSALLPEARKATDRRYGFAYSACRRTIIMQEACDIMGFQLGSRRDELKVVEGEAVSQLHMIQFFQFGNGATFWNARSVYNWASKARDFIVCLPEDRREARQTDLLASIEVMLAPTIMPLPCQAGTQSKANGYKKKPFENRCAEIMGEPQPHATKASQPRR